MLTDLCDACSIQIGDIAPDFLAKTTEGEFFFHKWMADSWCVLFSHPNDYTPVCTTELGAVARLKTEFDKRNVKVIALSENSLESHHGWIKDINETQNVHIEFPIISDDHTGTIARLYGMIHPHASETSTVRAVFIISPDKKVCLTMCYPATTGRNFEEILRVIDSLQLTKKYKIGTPANWKYGQECVVSTSVSNEQLAQLFPLGCRQVKPYLRFTPQPENHNNVNK